MAKNYYDILGVSKSANDEQIKSAYRKLAMKYHPDRNPDNKDAEAKFKEATEAYDVLKDPQKRKNYDMFGTAQSSQRGSGGFGAGGFGTGGFDFNDIFDEFFGGSKPASPTAQLRGADLKYNLRISLEEAFHGCTKKVNLHKLDKCTTCNGTGSKSNASPITCNYCNGRGKIRSQSGFFSVDRICNACLGTGELIKNPCSTCSGKGRVNTAKVLSVKIPAGIPEGMKIKLAGQGEAGIRNNPAGDLYVHVLIADGKKFKKSHNDLYTSKSISFIKAALGDTINVDTIEGGQIELKIPEGTQPGQTFRAKGKGMSIYNKGDKRGDMYIKMDVFTPSNLNQKQRNLLKEFYANDKEEEKSAPKKSIFDIFN